MKRFAAAALLAALLPGTAPAQSTYESNCRRENGAIVCERTYKADNGYESTTKSSYSRGRYTSTTETTPTSPPEEFSNGEVYFDRRAAARKAARLRKEGYKAPGEHALGCTPPLHMTARDGCQP